MFKAFALFLLLVSSGLQAQPSLHTDLPLSYLAQADEQARDRPLVIFLHGSGSNEQDLFGLAPQIPDRFSRTSCPSTTTTSRCGRRRAWNRAITSGLRRRARALMTVTLRT